MAKGNGICNFCEKRITTGKPIYCVTCRQLFHALLMIRNLKRKTPRPAYRKILNKVKYLEVLKAMKI